MTAAPQNHESTSQLMVEITRRIGAGDSHAEAELVERFTRGLHAYLRRLGCPPELAEDLHQETFRVVIERLRGSGIEEPEALPGFVRGTARHLHLAVRRQAARRRTEADEELIAGVEDPEAGQLNRVLDAESAGLVRRLLAELEPPRDRQILYRFYIAEDHKESICEDLGLSSLHFNRVLFRARRRFKSLLEGFEKRQRLSRAS